MLERPPTSETRRSSWAPSLARLGARAAALGALACAPRPYAPPDVSTPHAEVTVTLTPSTPATSRSELRVLVNGRRVPDVAAPGHAVLRVPPGTVHLRVQAERWRTEVRTRLVAEHCGPSQCPRQATRLVTEPVELSDGRCTVELRVELAADERRALELAQAEDGTCTVVAAP